GAEWTQAGRGALRLERSSPRSDPGVRVVRFMSAPMQAPRGGWLVATLGSLVVLVVVSLLSSGPLDTLGIDLRHRWVVLTAPATTPQSGDGATGVGMNVFLEQEVEPGKRQRSLELLQA